MYWFFEFWAPVIRVFPRWKKFLNMIFVFPDPEYTLITHNIEKKNFEKFSKFPKNFGHFRLITEKKFYAKKKKFFKKKFLKKKI